MSSSFSAQKISYCPTNWLPEGVERVVVVPVGVGGVARRVAAVTAAQTDCVLIWEIDLLFSQKLKSKPCMLQLELDWCTFEVVGFIVALTNGWLFAFCGRYALYNFPWASMIVWSAPGNFD